MLRPFIWPTRLPVVSISTTSCRINSCARSRSRDARRTCSSSARSTSARAITSAIRLARPVVRLRQYVADLVDEQRELAGVVREPRGVFEDETDPVAVDRPQAVAPDDGRNQPRVDRLARGRAIDIVLEIGEHLEMLADFRVEGGEQVIKQAIAEQDHLEIERDRSGSSETVLVRPMNRPTSSISISRWRSVRFSADQLNGSISRRRTSSSRNPPFARCIAPGLISRKLVTEHALLRDIFDRADQVAQCRMQLLDDWHRVFLTGVADQHVDLVAVERPAEARFGQLILATLRLHHEHARHCR